MKRFLLGLCLAIAALYGGSCLVLFLSQRSYLYFPEEIPKARRPEDLTLQVPGASLRISARAHPGPEALIYFGGNAEDVSRSLEPLALGFPDHALYLMHYRGYGGSTGQPSEEALHGDARALFDWVQARHSKILVLGRSLGSGVAIRLAAERPVQRLVLITPFDSLLALAEKEFPMFPTGLLLKDRFESWRVAPRVKAPTLLLAAEKDDVVPGASTQGLLRAFSPGVAKLKILPGVGHNSISASPEYLPSLRRGE